MTGHRPLAHLHRHLECYQPESLKTQNLNLARWVNPFMIRPYRNLAAVLLVCFGSSGRSQTVESKPVAHPADSRMTMKDGLWLWLDAAAEQDERIQAGQEPLVAGQGVDYWHDRSGQGRHLVQRSRTARPAWDQSADGLALRFDGDDFLAWSGGKPEAAPQAATLIVVAAPASNDGQFNAFVSLSKAGGDDFMTGLNLDLGGQAAESWSTLSVEGIGQPGAVNLMKSDVPFGRFHVVSLRTRPGPAGTEARFDGSPQGTRDRGDGTIAMEELTIGARFNRYGPTPAETPFVQQFFRGRIAEVLIFDRTLPDAELATVETYLQRKYEPKPEAIGSVIRVGRPIVPADAPAVQMLVPGFAVRELPVDLTNINNLTYAPDGRLFVAGYDGRLHLLQDTNGDGLEDTVTTFRDQKSEDYPLGMAFHDGALFVVRRHQISRYEDTNGDGVPDREQVVANWQDPHVPEALLDARRVSGGLGLAIGTDGTIYTSTGSLNTFHPYMLAGSDGKPPKPGDENAQGVTSRYDLRQTAGAVLKFAPGSTRPEVVVSGVRYLTSMQFNRHGDLFATDQEGATWLPNGNPFDELLQIQTGRHYGFPPRHPRLLPSVIDEPSVFDYAPQHQSTCGFRFNEPLAAQSATWGPAFWAGDAMVTGESRGKLFRTKLVKTPAGYVAQNQIIACMALLPVDVALAPAGDLLVAGHTGDPDWGSGPGGRGRLCKFSYVDPTAPQPVATWAASPTETWVEFDKPLKPEDWKNLQPGTHIEAGQYVAAGDRFERLRPGYAVVQRQGATPRYELPVLSTALGQNGRSILIRTPARTAAASFSVTLPFPSAAGDEARHLLPRSSGLDLGFDLTGIQANWQSTNRSETWSGWLPHPDWNVSTELTSRSEPHTRLRSLVDQAGVLTLSGQLDLRSMLHPAVQPGSKLDYEYPPEIVRVEFSTGAPLTLSATAPGRAEAVSATSARLTASSTTEPLIPFTLTLNTSANPLTLSVTWSTSEDPRPRALPLRRILMPWVTPTDLSEPPAEIQEIAGGNWDAGKELFLGSKQNCVACHTMRGAGGKIGPDLSNVIHRDYASVMKDIQQPSVAINPDFLSYVVELENGQILTGVLSGSTDDELKIGGADGKVISVPRNQVSELAPSQTSVMPEKLLEGLTETQIRDLMTFLLTKPPTDGK